MRLFNPLLFEIFEATFLFTRLVFFEQEIGMRKLVLEQLFDSFVAFG